MYIQCVFRLIENEILVLWKENMPENMVRIYTPEEIETVLDYSQMLYSEIADLLFEEKTITTGLYEHCVDALFEKEKV